MQIGRNSDNTRLIATKLPSKLIEPTHEPAPRPRDSVVSLPLRLIAIACCLSVGFSASAADIKSISRLAAGPEDILFVADWKAARIHAITLPRADRPAGTAFNILDLETLLSKQVGGAKITVEDMVARPGTAEVYVAVSYGRRKRRRLSW